MNSVIHIKDICFSYEKKVVLNHLSADFKKASICFIMGNNGSGKTTLLKNILGFLSPQSGTILVDNADIKSFSKQALSKIISYVPQAIYLNTDFLVIDYLSLGRTPHLGINCKLSDEDYDIIDNYSDMLGIKELYNIPFNKLSGGQKQLVAVARSLIQNTPTIILDEPMSALDIGKQVDLLKVFCNLVKEGKTIVLTTHNPNHALTVESISFFMNDGTITAYGKSSDIITEDVLNNIYGSNISLEKGKKQKSVIFNTDSFANQQMCFSQEV